jgi:anti-anti-sigma factor
MEIGDELTEIASKIGAGLSLVLDFQNVKSLSTATVGQIVQLRNATERDGVELRLRHVSPEIQDILQEMHLDQVFHVDGRAE